MRSGCAALSQTTQKLYKICACTCSALPSDDDQQDLNILFAMSRSPTSNSSYPTYTAVLISTFLYFNVTCENATSLISLRDKIWYGVYQRGNSQAITMCSTKGAMCYTFGTIPNLHADCIIVVIWSFRTGLHNPSKYLLTFFVYYCPQSPPDTLTTV